MNIPLWKLFRWFKGPQLWATGDWQLHQDNMPAHASPLMQSFLAKHHQIIQGTHPPYAPDLVPQLLDFPKTKIPFERKVISDYGWNLGKYDRTTNDNWENCVRPQGAYFEGDCGVIVLCTMSLVSSSMSVFFIVCGWILSGQTYIHIHIWIYTYVYT